MKKFLSIVVVLFAASATQAQTLPPPGSDGCFPPLTEMEKKALEQEASTAMMKAMIQQDAAKLALEGLESHLAQQEMIYDFLFITYQKKKANGDYTAAEDKAIVDLAKFYVESYKIETGWAKNYNNAYGELERDLCDLYGPLMGMNGYIEMKAALAPCAVLEKAFLNLSKSVLESDETTVALASGPLTSLTKLIAQQN